jgi:hypothetical protein
MEANSLPNVGWLISQLEDPFLMFPLEGVVSSLTETLNNAQEHKWRGMGPWGLSRKFWTVEMEHYHEEVGYLAGAVFVLGQAAITQTISLLTKMGTYAQAHGVIPTDKKAKMIAHASVDQETNLSKILLIDAVANYFKHVPEWPDSWDPAEAKGVQAETMKAVLQLGLAPADPADNLEHAIGRLGTSHSDPKSIPNCIQEWREAWARVLYAAFGLADPNEPITSDR